jgi:hypothetical protein
VIRKGSTPDDLIGCVSDGNSDVTAMTVGRIAKRTGCVDGELSPARDLDSVWLELGSGR